MTRKELAKEIYKLNIELGIISGTTGERIWINRVLNGCGYLKPISKSELINWYNNLLERAGR